LQYSGSPNANATVDSTASLNTSTVKRKSSATEDGFIDIDEFPCITTQKRQRLQGRSGHGHRSATSPSSRASPLVTAKPRATDFSQQPGGLQSLPAHSPNDDKPFFRMNSRHHHVANMDIGSPGTAAASVQPVATPANNSNPWLPIDMPQEIRDAYLQLGYTDLIWSDGSRAATAIISRPSQQINTATHLDIGKVGKIKECDYGNGGHRCGPLPVKGNGLPSKDSD
jgi:hypothetical protein